MHALTRRLILLIPPMLASQGCAGESDSLQDLVQATRTTDLKVLIIGIDGATLSIIEPMIAEGKLPRTAELIRNGSHGFLESVEPTSSASIWNTIVTGRPREVHGITHFLKDRDAEPEDWVLMGTNDRKVGALWNWTGAFGKTVGFQGWWSSWPADPVDGWFVSDRMVRNRWTEWVEDSAVQSHVTFPEELAAELAPLVLDPEDPPMDEIRALVRLTEREEALFLAATAPIKGHGLSVFKFAYCVQRTYEEIALRMLTKGQPDLMGVFLVCNDPICHTFWHHYQPQFFARTGGKKSERLGKLIPNFYEHNDRYLTRLLDAVDDDTVVLIMSDHGFQVGDLVPHKVSDRRFDELQLEAESEGYVTVGQSGRHHINGVLIAAGPGIRRGVRVDAHIFDITPTVLALMGLPVAEDMEGRVLEELLTPDFLAEHPVRTIASYEDYFERTPIDAEGDASGEEIIDRLRALGYVK